MFRIPKIKPLTLIKTRKSQQIAFGSGTKQSQEYDEAMLFIS